MLTTTTIDSRQVYNDHRVKMRVDTVQMGDRPILETAVIENANSVVVVPITDDGEVLLVKQWRHAAQAVLLEAPAGHMDPGEAPQDAALRELQEEAGHSAENLAPLPGFWAAPSISTEYMHGFLATGLTTSSLPQDDDEDVELARTAISEIPDLIRNGTITDSKSIAALLSALYLYPESTVPA
ncbi:MAG: NUDIX hydrolase [Chloroflexi bacterium]|jgi:ADP-ribose pyrophosphatase|nr:NUDIX hydrolase [Chloroflexota bacterium]MBT4073821.1 NUDIX hydrolase [Chloroflexota bacterium]MBT5319136.1 NUDIX hydrolase [Chloroflexota bacterium]MBT6680469.1 NUDIX hydrolase [Chloroflexota bacterium]